MPTTRTTPQPDIASASDSAPPSDAPGVLRADARRNREEILLAARDVLVDRGPDAPLDEIARRAGVGNATLYRRFPDRQALLRAVVLDVYARVLAEARLALSTEADAFQALARYMHRALELRIGAVMPALVGQVEEDPQILAVRRELVQSTQQMVDVAHADGTLRPEVELGDIGPMLIRLSRPLPGRLPRDLDDALAHRQLDVLIDGLRAVPDRPAGMLRGPAVTIEDLRYAGHDLSADSAQHSAQRPAAATDP
jgi:AcrR family transcriptional regulator